MKLDGVIKWYCLKINCAKHDNQEKIEFKGATSFPNGSMVLDATIILLFFGEVGGKF